MPRPGVQFTERASAPSRYAPIDTGVGFMVGFAERGPATTYTVSKDFDEWTVNHGAAVSYGLLAAAAESFFRDGGGKLITARVVGTTPVNAGRDFLGATVGTLRVAARFPGAYYNTWTVDIVVTGTDFRIILKDSTGTVLEDSGLLADAAAAVAWSAGSSRIVVTDLPAAGDDPVAITNAALTGGSDDNATAAQAQWDAALALFVRALGPGQVAAPGNSILTMLTALANHAAANNRFAIGDLANTTSKATLTTAAAAVTALSNARHIMLLGGWEIIPALVSGAARTVPRSGTIMGTIARVDNDTGNPNIAAAGAAGDSVFATGLVYEPSDIDRQDLNALGVNVALNYYGAIRNYGFRTAASPTALPNHWMASNVRLDMAIRAEAVAEGEKFVFDQIDGRGHKAAEFGGVLTGILQRYEQIKALYGDTPAEAFQVNTGPTVNTPARNALGELWALIQVRRSPFAELVNIEIRVVSIREELTV